jgi:hypothetical protein
MIKEKETQPAPAEPTQPTESDWQQEAANLDEINAYYSDDSIPEEIGDELVIYKDRLTYRDMRSLLDFVAQFGGLQVDECHGNINIDLFKKKKHYELPTGLRIRIFTNLRRSF